MKKFFSIQRLYRYFADRPLCCHPGRLLVRQPGSHRRFQAGRIPCPARPAIGRMAAHRQMVRAAGAYRLASPPVLKREYPKVTSETEDEVVIDFTEKRRTTPPARARRENRAGRPR